MTMTDDTSLLLIRAAVWRIVMPDSTVIGCLRISEPTSIIMVATLGSSDSWMVLIAALSRSLTLDEKCSLNAGEARHSALRRAQVSMYSRVSSVASPRAHCDRFTSWHDTL